MKKFDYIFFTGKSESRQVRDGKSSQTSHTGHSRAWRKSPCIVDETADLKIMARRIVWGDFKCKDRPAVAPDYVLVQHSVKKS